MPAVIEGWHLIDDSTPLNAREAAESVRRRLDQGLLETWLEHDRGMLLAVVSNRSRALVMLLDGPGNPGAHAIDPDATGEQDGYVLDNGQHDTHADRDTLPIEEALRTAEHILEHGRPPDDVAWQIDR